MAINRPADDDRPRAHTVAPSRRRQAAGPRRDSPVLWIALGKLKDQHPAHDGTHAPRNKGAVSSERDSYQSDGLARRLGEARDRGFA